MVLFLLFLVWPKGYNDFTSDDDEDPHHWFLPKAIVCMVLSLLFCCFGGIVWLMSELLIFNSVQKMDSATEKVEKYARKR